MTGLIWQQLATRRAAPRRVHPSLLSCAINEEIVFGLLPLFVVLQSTSSYHLVLYLCTDVLANAVDEKFSRKKNTQKTIGARVHVFEFFFWQRTICGQLFYITVECGNPNEFHITYEGKVRSSGSCVAALVAVE